MSVAMRWMSRLSPPQRLLTLFLGATILPSAALVWLGWTLVRQDAQLERERVRTMLEGGASDAAAALGRAIDTIDRDLPAMTRGEHLRPGDEALAVRIRRTGIAEQTGVRLLYVPTAAIDRDEPADTIWEHAELAEYADRDPAAAARA